MPDFYAKHWILTAPAGVPSSGPMVATDLSLCQELIDHGYEVRGPYVSLAAEAKRVLDGLEALYDAYRASGGVPSPYEVSRWIRTERELAGIPVDNDR